MRMGNLGATGARLVALQILAGAGALCACGRIDQPIEFNHKVHVEQEIACDTCHEHVLQDEYASLPHTDALTRPRRILRVAIDADRPASCSSCS